MLRTVFSAFQTLSLGIPKRLDVGQTDRAIAMLQMGKLRRVRRQGCSGSLWPPWNPHTGPQPLSPGVVTSPQTRPYSANYQTCSRWRLPVTVSGHARGKRLRRLCGEPCHQGEMTGCLCIDEGSLGLKVGVLMAKAPSAMPARLPVLRAGLESEPQPHHGAAEGLVR